MPDPVGSEPVGPGLTVTSAGAVRTLTMNTPANRNAFSPAMRERLLEEMTRAAGDPDVRAVVLTGAGRGFCSGGDTRAMGSVTPAEKRASMLRSAEFVEAVVDLPVPVVAAVHGYAVGAGLALALVCDLVVAGRDTRFKVGFGALGLTPDLGAHHLLREALGPHRTKQLLWTRPDFDAVQAHEFGLVQLLADESEVGPVAARTAAELAAGPTLAFAATKRVLASPSRAALRATLTAEAEESAALRTSADHLEGLAAARERRPAVFRGR